MDTELIIVGAPPQYKDGYNIIIQKDPLNNQFLTLYFIEGKPKLHQIVYQIHMTKIMNMKLFKHLLGLENVVSSSIR